MSNGLHCGEGVDCGLTKEAKERYTSTDDAIWLVSDAVLEEIDNDVQAIVNCTKEGDVISFDVTSVVQPSSLVTIPWKLTLSSSVDDGGSNDGDVHRHKTRTKFTCPQSDSGLFLVQ